VFLKPWIIQSQCAYLKSFHISEFF